MKLRFPTKAKAALGPSGATVTLRLEGAFSVRCEPDEIAIGPLPLAAAQELARAILDAAAQVEGQKEEP